MKLSYSTLFFTLVSISAASPLSSNQKRDQVTCYTQLATDHFGGDYAQLTLSSFDACGAACQADGRCVTAQYAAYNTQCYLKSVLNVATSDARVDSVVCRPSQPTASTTTTSQTAGPSACTIVRGTDHYGGDYSSFSTGDFDSCAGACQDDSRCVTAQYVQDQNMCYLKSVLNEATSDARVDSIVCRAPQPQASTTTASTTTASTTTASTTTASTTTASTTTVSTTIATTTSASTTTSAPTPSCTIIRQVDYYGGDYGSVSVPSFDECVTACQLDSQCVTAQFRAAYQRCYLKYVLTTQTSDVNVDTVICRGPVQGGTTTTSSTSVSTTTTTTPAAITSSSTTTATTTTVSTTTSTTSTTTTSASSTTTTAMSTMTTSTSAATTTTTTTTTTTSLAGQAGGCASQCSMRYPAMATPATVGCGALGITPNVASGSGSITYFGYYGSTAIGTQASQRLTSNDQVPNSVGTDKLAYYSVPGFLPPGTFCQDYGYLLHLNSGLCVTVRTSSSSPLFDAQPYELQICSDCGTGPPQNQLFCRWSGDATCFLFFGNADPTSYYGLDGSQTNIAQTGTQAQTETGHNRGNCMYL